jgi:hypothetical protein
LEISTTPASRGRKKEILIFSDYVGDKKLLKLKVLIINEIVVGKGKREEAG